MYVSDIDNAFVLTAPKELIFRVRIEVLNDCSVAGAGREPRKRGRHFQDGFFIVFPLGNNPLSSPTEFRGVEEEIAVDDLHIPEVIPDKVTVVEVSQKVVGRHVFRILGIRIDALELVEPFYLDFSRFYVFALDERLLYDKA